VTIIRVFYKNTDKIKQLPKLHKYNNLILQLLFQVLHVVIKFQIMFLLKRDKIMLLQQMKLGVFMLIVSCI